MSEFEVVPSILRRTFERIEEDWEYVHETVEHIQIDITDGVFAGDGTFRELSWFQKLENKEKIELHMMVQNPSYYIDEIIKLNPSRCVFHLEAFADAEDIKANYAKLRQSSSIELGLAINPETPTKTLDDHVDFLDYILFMGYHPGFPNQQINPIVYQKISDFNQQYTEMIIEVDGGVKKDTIEPFVIAGARILCANTAIFGSGNPVENIRHLELIAEASLKEVVH